MSKWLITFEDRISPAGRTITCEEETDLHPYHWLRQAQEKFAHIRLLFAIEIPRDTCGTSDAQGGES